MKHADIKEGEEYALYQGRGWIKRNALRCKVLDVEKAYKNFPIPSPFLYYSSHSSQSDKIVRYPRPNSSFIPSNARILVEVYLPVMGDTEVNPDTGEPWTDEELGWTDWQIKTSSRKRTKFIQISEKAVHYAARPAEIRCLWSELQETLRQEDNQRAAAEIIARERRAQEAVERAEKEAEQERRREQEAKERAQREEFYDTRLEPQLIELGIEHTKDHYYKGGRLVLTYEAMARLLSMINGEQ